MIIRRPLNLLEYLDRAHRRFPNRVALVCNGRQITYAVLHHWCMAVAGGLAAAGLSGRRVVVFTPTCAELVVAYYAGFMAGVTVIPLNYSFRTGELRAVLTHCRADGLITHPALLPELEAANDLLATIEHKFVIGREGSGFRSFDALAVNGPVTTRREDRPAVVFHTSGTTGTPKGVSHTLASASYFARCYQALALGEPHPVTLIARNCYHSGGFFHLTGALSAGATCHLADRPTGFDPEAFAHDLAAHRVTQVFLSVSMLNALLTCPALSPRAFTHAAFVSVGADEVRPSHHTRLREFTRLPLSVRYSSTEATCVSINADPDPAQRTRSVGRPHPHFAWRLDPVPDGDGADELLLRGPAVFAGYLDHPDANNAAFTPDGWYRTGDLFRETDGGLAFAGRRHDLIKVGGKFVAPAEIEAVADTYPAFTDTTAVAAPHPVEVQVPHLFARPRSSVVRFDPADFRAFMAARMAGYKVPERVHLLAEWPTNSGGKVDRRALRQRAASDQEAGQLR